MPARAQDLKRALGKLGVTVSKPSSGGSHWLAERDGRSYPIPLHNGTKTEVSDSYIKGVCRAFEIDERELRELL